MRENTGRYSTTGFEFLPEYSRFVSEGDMVFFAGPYLVNFEEPIKGEIVEADCGA